MKQEKINPDVIFETSWEVCNKVGGIHTVISTKAKTLVEKYKENLILIGPDVYRESDEHPEFIEDRKLFEDWKEQAIHKGYRLKTGHWNIKGSPVVVLVDFSVFMSKKDNILTELWEEFGLDSLSGQWDYIEPVLFGYAAGTVIEDFYNFYLDTSKNVVAHWHEWMTGSGLLYLKKQKVRIANVFTTHATILGRSIAGNQIPLYSNLRKYAPEVEAGNFNVKAKWSLESIAAREADCFTTVSEITSLECKQFLTKEVDLVTPNGFEDSFVSEGEELKLRKVEAKVKLLEVAEALLSYEVDKDSFTIVTSGRYEYNNKGLDVFIKALAELNNKPSLDKDILAFIMVPASHHGPRRDVFKNLKDTDNVIELNNVHITHYLNDIENDPVIRQIKESGLTNEKKHRVKVIFVPSYLNGNDGLFNKSYYDLIVGCDLTVFASYYEPWGYTPLESLAFHIPTVTTSLAGFGMWVSEKFGAENLGVNVIERNDFNDQDVIGSMASIMEKYYRKSLEDRNLSEDNAKEISRSFLWKNFIEYYFEAYDIAFSKLDKIGSYVCPVKKSDAFYFDKKSSFIHPNWKRLIINQRLPEKLKALDEISRNLWWSWTPEAVDLFRSINPEVWCEVKENLIEFLERIPLKKLQELENDNNFIKELNDIHRKFLNYMLKKKERKEPKIAYFSMEFGLHQSLKIYSGGLGILAGDYLKEASDQNVNMIGVGLLYRYGYFNQKISAKGQQVASYKHIQFSKTPAKPVRDAEGNWVTVSLGLPGRRTYARVWCVNVGRIELYLLDTDFEDNIEQDRAITHQLYGGDMENRLKQEILLGIGGIRLLNELGINADVFHCNEGHAAFIGLERTRKLIEFSNLSFSESLEIVRGTTLFTTHTPVPAGHDAFPEELIRIYLRHYPDHLQISWDQFINLGKANPSDDTERFSMSHLAANMSQEINGVSKLHGSVSREMLAKLWPGYFPEELHVGHVTNGVHYATWASHKWRAFFKNAIGNDFEENLDDMSAWEKIHLVDDKEIWDLKKWHRKKLVDFVHDHLENEDYFLYENPKSLVEIKENLQENALIIGFARRFATYKRAHLLFRNLERLSKIVNNPAQPVIFIFAGKAHPNDNAGQDLIKFIIETSKQPDFMGKIIFLPDYDIQLAKILVQGVDVWLNTPTRPLEASGTSGQKVLMNGGLNFSVLDGWWLEGYMEKAGWGITEKRTYSNQELQDELDAEIIYSIFENDLIPLFYERDQSGVSAKWVEYIKNSISKVAPMFTTNRMLRDYIKQYYNTLYDRKLFLEKGEFETVEKIAEWKSSFFRKWKNLEIISVKQFDISKEQVFLGQKYEADISIKLNGISADDIGVELVFSDMILENNKVNIVFKKEMELAHHSGDVANYKLRMTPELSGAFDFGFRVFPKKDFLPHRQDFSFIKWI